ncbi:hypothetical protein V6O07_00460 [Arthrospira platensis SPKY2]
MVPPALMRQTPKKVKEFRMINNKGLCQEAIIFLNQKAVKLFVIECLRGTVVSKKERIYSYPNQSDNRGTYIFHPYSDEKIRLNIYEVEIETKDGQILYEEYIQFINNGFLYLGLRVSDGSPLPLEEENLPEKIEWRNLNLEPVD